MGAPRLNRKLVLEVPAQVPDGAGGFTESWAARGTLWAQVTAGAGRETLGEAVQLSRTVLKIIVRATPYEAPSRPRPEHRFRDGSRVFRILSVAESDADARYLICHAIEEVAT